MSGCVGKKNIKIPLSDPLPHPKLAQMQSLSIEEKDGVIYFEKSKKYKNRGITIVVLKGDPYEMGYAHGVLLKDEMKQDGQIVKSTRNSTYDFKGKVDGYQLKGKMMVSSGTYFPFLIRMPSNGMSFKGTLEVISWTDQITGKRIE